jgi:hypothetical protein
MSQATTGLWRFYANAPVCRYLDAGGDVKLIVDKIAYMHYIRNKIRRGCGRRPRGLGLSPNSAANPLPRRFFRCSGSANSAAAGFTVLSRPDPYHVEAKRFIADE